TATHGALGCLAFGIGASEVAHVLATQTLWQEKPKTMRINIEGELSPGVVAKDVILHLISVIGANGATGYMIEYAGSTVRNLSIEGRMTMCNMSIEAGGRAGMVAPDKKTFDYIKGRKHSPKNGNWDLALKDWRTLFSDKEATFDKEIYVKSSDIAPGGQETRNMINKHCFSIMKPDSIIANVGRGEVIQEEALYEALSTRRIRGGIIDVWYNYPSKINSNPWPSKFPFHKLDNVIMSPHNSAWTQAMSHRRWDFVAANLDRLAKGAELKNICFNGERVD
ncbi:aconitase family protein, partial [Rhodospirillaceae bacterium]|nr:aconitase family protein [Rhodospirillaceae bacterium]